MSRFGLTMLAIASLCLSGAALATPQLQRDVLRVKNPVAKKLMHFVSAPTTPKAGTFAPYKLVESRKATFPQIMLPAPRPEHHAADKKAIDAALWGQPGAENLVQFFKSPRRKGPMHHIYVSLLMPDKRGNMVPTVFDNLDNEKQPTTTGLRKMAERISEGTSDRFGVFVEYDAKTMQTIRDFYTLGSGPEGRKEAVGAFDPYADPRQAANPRGRRAGCTSYLAACRIEGGKSMVETAGAKDKTVATSLLSSLLTESKSIAFSVVHNAQVDYRRMLQREGFLDAKELPKKELEEAAQHLSDPHSLWFYFR